MPGLWEDPIQPFGPLPDGMRAMHMAQLKTGKILVFGDDTADEQLWTPPAGPFVSVPNPTTDLRCAGHSALADGRLLVVGLRRFAAVFPCTGMARTVG